MTINEILKDVTKTHYATKHEEELRTKFYRAVNLQTSIPNFIQYLNKDHDLVESEILKNCIKSFDESGKLSDEFIIRHGNQEQLEEVMFKFADNIVINEDKQYIEFSNNIVGTLENFLNKKNDSLKNNNQIEFKDNKIIFKLEDGESLNKKLLNSKPGENRLKEFLEESDKEHENLSKFKESWKNIKETEKLLKKTELERE